jgi:hypothetical protein
VLREEGLLDAALVGADGRRGERADVERLDGRWVVGRQEAVERVVLIGELGLANGFAEVEENARSAEDAAARAKNVVIDAGAG